MLDQVERARRKVKLTLANGREVSGQLEGTALAGDYNCGNSHVRVENIDIIKIL